MNRFLLKQITDGDIHQELTNIGFDKSYIDKAKSKFQYSNFKIFNLSSVQANILKQTALTVGADCGTHHDVIMGTKELTSCILGGSISQLNKIADKLTYQPFGLKDLGLELKDKILVKKSNKTKIMGVLNLTPDSFSDGGNYVEYNDAITYLNRIIEDGADIIDIGAESTKPYSTPVTAEVQLKKILPILNYINKNNIKIPISIDTRSAQVAQNCIDNGSNIINDVSGFDYDSEMVNVLAKNNHIKIVLQHSKGTPENMQDNPSYENVIDDIYKKLNEKVEFSIEKGIKKENIIIDPGIGFGKTREHNLAILNNWKDFKSIGCPVLIGLSRKSLLGIPEATNEEKDLYSLALSSKLIQENIDILRVHNVKIYKNFQSIISL